MRVRHRSGRSVTAFVLVSGLVLAGAVVGLVTAPAADAVIDFDCDSPEGIGYFVNTNAGSVSLIYTGTDSVTKTIPVGGQPYGVGATPDGSKVYVAGGGADRGLVVIDTDTFAVKSVPAPAGAPWATPVGAWPSPDGTKMFVSNITGSRVTVVDTTTDTATGSINLGGNRQPGWEDALGNNLYVANSANNGSGGFSVIDMTTNALSRTVTYASGAHELAVNSGFVVTANQNQEIQVRTTANPTAVARTITVPTASGAVHGLAFVPGTNYVVATTNTGNATAGHTTIYDATSGAVVRDFVAGAANMRMPITSPISPKVYVAGGNAAGTNGTMDLLRVSGAPSTWSYTRNQAPLGAFPDNHTPAFSCLRALGGTKALADSTVSIGQSTRLTVTLENYNVNPEAGATGAAVTDNLPAGLEVSAPANAATTCTGGTVTAPPGGQRVALTGGTVPAATIAGNTKTPGRCTVTVDVTGVAPGGSYTNTIPAGGITADGLPASTDAVTNDFKVVVPSADDDTASGPFGQDITGIDVLGNDAAADGATLDPASVVFTADDQPDGASLSDDGKTLTVPDEGVYTVNDDGTIDFAPADGFTGSASPVSYQLRDTDGNTTGAQLSVTIGAPPTASDDSDSTPFGQPVTTRVLANDTGDETYSPLDPTSVVFTADNQPDGAVLSDGGKTLTVPDQGVYTIDADGAVTFTPADGFSGAATPVTYQVADEAGNTATATLTDTVGVPPTVDDDTATTPYGDPVDIDLLGNDSSAQDTSLDPTSVVFTDADQPVGAVVSDDGKTLRIPGKGTFVIDPVTGAARFTPADGFSGEVPPVTYRVADRNGATGTATVSVTVGPPPNARDDADSTHQGDPVTTNVLGNDISGAANPLDPTSVVFTEANQPTGATVSDGGRTLTVPGEGVYTVDPKTGAVTFAPEADFVGRAQPVTYRVADVDGATDTATLTVNVTNAFTATDDTASTDYNTPVDVRVLGNDQPAADGSSLDVSSVVFPEAGQPAGATVGDGGRTLTVPGEGVYAADPQSGVVTFTPDPDFQGDTTSAVTYQVTDSRGRTSAAQLTVAVGEPAPPTVQDDQATTYQGDPVTVDVLGNDAGNGNNRIDTTSVVFTQADAPTGATVSDGGRTLTVPGQGVYTVDPDTGAVTFTPEPAFTGPATPVLYQVTTADGAKATAQLAVTVTGAFTASDDAATTPYDTPVDIDVVGNDQPAQGSGNTLDKGSVVFTQADQPAGATVSDGGKTLTVPGEGTYTVTDDGTVRFVPLATFMGASTTPVTYQVSDSRGRTRTAQVTVAVGGAGPADAHPNQTTTTAGTPVTLRPLANDDATPGQSFVRSSLVLTTTGAPAGARLSTDGKTLTVPGEGVWQVNDDGTVVFTPADGFTGVATPVTYQVTDTAGRTVSSTMQVTVTAADTPPGGGTGGTSGGGTGGGGGSGGTGNSGGSGTGSTTGSSGSSTGSNGVLPGTGGPASAVLFGGLAVLLAGCVLVATALRRRVSGR